MIGLMATRGVLYWKREAVTPGGELFGRAWVIEEDGTMRQINDGDPISRAEALRLADAGEYTVDAEA
ncbi:MAG TPA: hypothetical protein VGI69_02445 [Gaiellaceae bacterium]|jgi:hypothetical protein